MVLNRSKIEGTLIHDVTFGLEGDLELDTVDGVVAEII